MAQPFLLLLAHFAATPHVYHRHLKLPQDFVRHLPGQLYIRILRLHEPNPPSVGPIAPLVVIVWMWNREAGFRLPPFLQVRQLLVALVELFLILSNSARRSGEQT